MDWPTPTSVTEVRSFMRLGGYYQCFIMGFSRLARRITSLQTKGMKYDWTKKCERALQELKSALMSAPILLVPEPFTEFAVFTNVPLDGIGAALM